MMPPMMRIDSDDGAQVAARTLLDFGANFEMEVTDSLDVCIRDSEVSRMIFRAYPQTDGPNISQTLLAIPVFKYVQCCTVSENKVIIVA
jgi:hypothetical protein